MGERERQRRDGLEERERRDRRMRRERERLRPMYWTRKWVSKEVCQFVKKIVKGKLDFLLLSWWHFGTN